MSSMQNLGNAMLQQPAMQTPAQAMPPPATAPNQFLHALGKALQDHHTQGSTAPEASQNPYALNYAQNPYAIEGGTPFAGIVSAMQAHAAQGQK